MPEMTRARMTFGTEQVEAPAKALSAGALAADLSDGALRGIRWHGVEVLRGINCPIRDENWGTFLPENVEETLREEDGGFCYERSFTVAGGALAVRLVYSGRADGTLTADLTLQPRVDFRTNRSGFTALHPLNGFVGAELTVHHGSGAERIVVAERIAPAQPVFDIVGLDCAVNGARVSIRFSGEVFEMEDQRNWTDASFKTYCRPLAKPWPYVLPAGETVRQGIALTLSGAPRERAGAGEQAAVTFRAADETCPVVALAAEDGWLPGAGDRNHLSALGVKAWQIRIGRGDMAALEAALPLLAELGASYDLEIVVSDDPEAARRELAATAAICTKSPPAGVIALPQAYLKSYQPDGKWPTGLSPDEAADAARAAFPTALIGGGALAYFTELNRCRPDGARVDFVTHGTSGVVHAADDRSVIETLEALPQVFASAEAIAAGRAYRLGLVAIGMRSNPYGAAVASNPDLIRVPMAQTDPRQHGLFAAAWAVGALAATAGRRVSTLALAAPAGPFGIIAPAGARGGPLVPLFHVVRAAAAMSNEKRLFAERLPDGVFAVGCAGKNGVRSIFANVSATPQSVRLGAGAAVRTLDSRSFPAASADPLWLDHAPAERTRALTLEPFAVAFAAMDRAAG
jgi:hypothetical protein